MHIIKTGDSELVDQLNPGLLSALQIVDGLNCLIALKKNSTVYGYVFSGTTTINGREIEEGEYFSIPNKDDEYTILVSGRTALFIRIGFLGQYIIGKIEDWGRVQYIDTCTDSLLVCPPRIGDPCLNSLHFPPNVNQTFHTHPSIRLGIVANGRGYSTIRGQEIPLEPGDSFFLDVDELHRFRTVDEGMTIIAYHPDSDWGPTDEVHPMLNRTILGGEK